MLHLLQNAAPVPVYLWPEDTSYFENEYQHNAGEFISSFVLWKYLCFLSVSENVTHTKKIPYFLKSWLLFHKSNVWFSYPISLFYVFNVSAYSQESPILSWKVVIVKDVILFNWLLISDYVYVTQECPMLSYVFVFNVKDVFC